MIGLQWFWIVLMSISSVLSDADTDYNVIKNDGSFSFGYALLNGLTTLFRY